MRTQCKELDIPAPFAKGVISEREEAGREWLAGLPGLLEKLCNAWWLTVEGEPLHGYLGLVIPVRRASETCVLKLTWPGDPDQEIAALQIWSGCGAVKLLDARPEDGALLLERLQSDRTLETVEINQAAAISGSLLRRLAVPASPELSARLPTLHGHVRHDLERTAIYWRRLNKPIPESFLAAAQALADELMQGCESLLVDYDLHFANVLAGSREPWVVIDPKVVVGDPEFGVFPLLLNRAPEARTNTDLERRLAILVGAGQLDEGRARGWTLVRAVEYWLWALSRGLTEDPRQARRIAEWLLNAD
jgi:streptomycin 6-kinase